MNVPYPSSVDNTWLKAAVIGSIWAAFEITIGSFLHNMRIPFAGALLSTSGAFLLLSFVPLWYEKGLIVRSGIVCALMKSISPSAIIMGPMVGIFMEAFIIEYILFFFGRNYFSVLLAGGLAVSWTLAQKIINLIILYGFDLVTIFKALYDYFIHQTGWSYLNPSLLLIIIFGAYMAIGGIAGFAGFMRGKKFIKTIGLVPHKNPQAFSFEGTNPIHRGVGQSPVINLILLIVWIIASLLFINKGWTWLALASGIGFLSYCAMRYKQSLRRLKKVSIWLQFIIITLAASILWDYFQTGKFFSTNGLIIGLEMNFRAMIILFGFSAIGVELRNPLIQSMLFRKNLNKLHATLNLSFAALPSVIEALPTPRNLAIRTSTAMDKIYYTAIELLEYFTLRSRPKTHIFILTGEVGQGKSGFLSQLISRFSTKENIFQGFVSKADFTHNQKDGYILTEIGTDRSIKLCSGHKNLGWFPFRKFFFNPEAIEIGKSIIKSALHNRQKILVIDEIGPLELEHNGWYPAIREVASEPVLQLWVVRNSLIDSIVLEWNIPRENIFDVAVTELSTLEKIVSEQLKASSLGKNRHV